MTCATFQIELRKPCANPAQLSMLNDCTEAAQPYPPPLGGGRLRSAVEQDAQLSKRDGGKVAYGSDDVEGPLGRRAVRATRGAYLQHFYHFRNRYSYSHAA